MAPTAAPRTACVIGAGAAGLAAAERLAVAGWDVTILEARDRIGGRCSRATLAGAQVDLGAEFAHGRNIVVDLCELAGIEARPMYSHDDEAEAHMRTYAHVGGALHPCAPGAHPAIDAQRALFDELCSDDRWDAPPGPVAGGSDSFAELARERGLSAELVGLLDATEAVEYATSLEGLGVREWRRRELFFSSAECSTDFSLQGRYVDVLDGVCARAVRAGARLRLSHPVSRVVGGDTTATVDGEPFSRVVLTVPLGVLRARALELRGVSDAFHDAVSAVGFHGASKVILAFAAAEWDARTARCAAVRAGCSMLFFGAPRSFAKQVWLRRAEPGLVLATAFLAGPRDAALAEGLSQGEAIARFAAQLSDALAGGEPLVPLDGLKVDWGQDAWARGGYSSPTRAQCGAWRRLRDTGSRTVLYAGEAAHERGSTVDSAIESGQWAADALLSHQCGS